MVARGSKGSTTLAIKNPVPISILFINPLPSSMGGIDAILPELIHGLDKKRYQVIVALPKQGDYVDRYRDAGAKVVFVEFNTIQRKRKLIATLYSLARLGPSVFRLYEIIRNHNVKIVHTQKINTLDGDIAARLAGVKAVHSIHEQPATPMFVWKLMAKLVYLIADRIIVTCDETFRKIPELSARRPKVNKVYNGITIPPLISLNDAARRDVLGNSIVGEAQIVGMVARLAPNKGQTTFLHAAPKVLAKFPDTQFVVVGDITSETSWEIEYREYLHRLAEHSGANGAIHFLGKRLDIYPILQALDIFVHPATSDILPTVVIQAMAVGKPIVVTSVGGLPELINHDFTGIVVPPVKPVALAEAIMWILKNPKKSREMGVSAQKIAYSKFSRETYVENTERIYRELIDSST